jgi:hypothetical protein
MFLKRFINCSAKAFLLTILLCGSAQLAIGQKPASKAKAKTTEAKVEAPPPEVWKDSATGLTWATKDSGSDMSYNQGLQYCSSLRTGGFSDWRLPTIDELDGIFDSKSKSLIKIKGPMQLAGSSVWSGSSTPSGEVWSFMFNYGGRSPARTSGHSTSWRVLCVRSGE